MRKVTAYFSACCVIVAIAWHFAPGPLRGQLTLNHRPSAKITEISQRPRKIYRFSIIPGGVYSSEELAGARRTDDVVRVHYIDFHADGVTLERLGRDSYMYVSYRKANHVYWTMKKHRIPKGEPVLSDGTHLARARCGNRLSLAPMGPTLPSLQLPEEVFDAPEPPQNLELPTSPLLTAAYDAPDLPFAMVLPKIQGFPAGPAAPISATPISGFFGPLFAPVGITGTTRTGSPGGGSSGGTTGGGSPGPTGGGTPGGGAFGSAPEPSTLGLFGLAITLALAFGAKRNLRRSRV